MRKKLLAVVLVLISSALVFICFLRRDNSQQDAQLQQIDLARKAVAATREQSHATENDNTKLPLMIKHASLPASKFSWVTLPPSDVPLVGVFDQLKDEATNGNPYAACRLFSDSMRCMVLPQARKQLELSRQEYASMNPQTSEAANLQQFIESKGGKIKKDERLCAGFEKPEKIEPWRFLLQAALADHMKAKEEFVLLSPVDRDDYAQNAAYLDAYRTYAPTFLLEAANAGYGNAVYRTASGYLGYLGDSKISRPGFGINLVEPNLYLAGVYTFALDTLPGHREQSASVALKQKVQSLLSPAELVKAKSEAAALVAKWKPEVINERLPNNDDQRPLTVGSMADRCSARY
jgi:hypothetical protein